MKQVALSVIVVSLASITFVHADAWDDYTKSYNRFIESSTTQTAQQQLEAELKLQELQKKAAKLEEKHTKDTAKLTKHKDMVASLQRTESILEDQLKKLQASAPTPPK